MLAARPILSHIKMIQKEWKRKELHRDIRILILQKAFGFLDIPEGEAIGWDILESALTNDNPEIVTALLTAEPKYVEYALPPFSSLLFMVFLLLFSLSSL